MDGGPFQAAVLGGIFKLVFLLTNVRFLVGCFPAFRVITAFWFQWAPLEWWALGHWPTWPIGKSGPGSSSNMVLPGLRRGREGPLSCLFLLVPGGALD